MDYSSLVQQIMTAYLIVLLIAIVLIFVFAHLVAKAARMKNRSYASFYWISLAVGPLIPAIIVATLPFNLDDPRHPRNRFGIPSQQQGNPADSDTSSTN